MLPGLARFGVDFGNGEVDRTFFPRDFEHTRYTSAKAQVLAHHPERFAWLEGERETRAHSAVLEWLRAQLARERAEAALDARDDVYAGFDAFARHVAEDIVVLGRDAGGAERASLVHVCFPSGWRPERILGRSFFEIHAPVPAFEPVLRAAPRLVPALFERGPFVRFVWTLSQDDALDHHSDHGARAAWRPDASDGYLRVERQITVPFAREDACLFLIRTYLYAFRELTSEERAVISGVLAQTEREVLEYKGLLAGLPQIVSQLARTAR
jgi:dimethylamine monooxygenase subunit A